MEFANAERIVGSSGNAEPSVPYCGKPRPSLMGFDPPQCQTMISYHRPMWSSNRCVCSTETPTAR